MTLYDGNRVCVLGEYGGLGLTVENHLWMPERNWGYVQYKSTEELTIAYIDLAEKLKKMIWQGFSEAIYTQTTDVEIEVNGLMTYDRKVIKMNAEKIRKVNLEIKASSGNPINLILFIGCITVMHRCHFLPTLQNLQVFQV